MAKGSVRRLVAARKKTAKVALKKPKPRAKSKFTKGKAKQMAHLESQLGTCSVRQLIVAMRMMRSDKDTLGFDYSKVSKSELLTRAVSMASGLTDDKREKASRMMEKAFGWKAADISGKSSAVGGSAGHAGEKGDGKLDPSAKHRYGHSSEQHGPPQGGERDAEDGEEGEGSEGKTDKGSMTPAQMKQAVKDAADEAVKNALEQQESELMDRLSKNVFKIEVLSDEGEPKDGEGGEGEEGDGESDGKKKRTIEADTPRHEIFKEVCQAVNKGLNVLLVGPAGCGKTHLAQEIAKVLDMPFRFTGAVSSEYKLLGFMSAQGQLVRTEYREAYEHGGVFLWDELDASSAQALLSFNAGLANGHQDFPDKVVVQNKTFRAIASANTYGNGADRMYIGRNQLDAASLDRFYVVNMDYDEQLEHALYGKDEWVLYVQKARRAMRELGGIRHVISMRAIQMALKMKGTGIPRQKVEQACLWRHLQEDDVSKIKRQMGKK